MGMKSHYQNFKIRDNSFFLKDFGISEQATSINDRNYWKMNCDSLSYFYLAGYLRKQGNVIMFLPSHQSLPANETPEYKLFDFNAPVNQSWKLIYQKDRMVMYGYTITFIGKHIAHDTGTLYEFSLTNIEFDTVLNHIVASKHQFYLKVSKQFGIVEITRFGVPVRVQFQATLYPKEKFVNNLGNGLEL